MLTQVFHHQRTLGVGAIILGIGGCRSVATCRPLRMSETLTAEEEKEARALGPTTSFLHEFFYKPLERASKVGGSPKTAVLMMNHADIPLKLTLTFSDIPGVSCKACHVRLP